MRPSGRGCRREPPHRPVRHDGFNTKLGVVIEDPRSGTTLRRPAGRHGRRTRSGQGDRGRGECSEGIGTHRVDTSEGTAVRNDSHCGLGNDPPRGGRYRPPPGAELSNCRRPARW
jgi:hypothetical protein